MVIGWCSHSALPDSPCQHGNVTGCDDVTTSCRKSSRERVAFRAKTLITMGRQGRHRVSHLIGNRTNEQYGVSLEIRAQKLPIRWVFWVYLTRSHDGQYSELADSPHFRSPRQNLVGTGASTAGRHGRGAETFTPRALAITSQLLTMWMRRTVAHVLTMSRCCHELADTPSYRPLCMLLRHYASTYALMDASSTHRSVRTCVVR